VSAWTEEWQRELYRRHARKAYKRAIRFLKDHEEEIVALGERRLLEGYALYEDRMFHWSYNELRQNELEEAADLVVYGVCGIAKGWK